MMAKIEWYQEILEQEPGSRVFFPLAKLLIASERREEAVQTLRKGLERHADFLEARLELINLLHELGIEPDRAREVGEVVRLFKMYPAFWDAWAAAEGESDLALAVRFIARASRSPGLSFSSVIARGLAAGEEAFPYGTAACPAGTAAVPVTPPCEEALSGQAAQAPAKGRVLHEDADFLAKTPESLDSGEDMESVEGVESAALGDVLPHVQLDDAVLADSVAPFAEVPADAGEEPDEPDDGDEPVSLRTRSMADVLAEQGDIAGALEIYQELEAAAPTPKEAAVLRERVMALAAQVNADAEQRTAQPESSGRQSKDADAIPAPQTKMMHLLETLADRLEARARG